MKRIQFLTKMIKEGKLQLVNPSENISYSYLSKSDSNLESAKILLKSDKLEESISLSYYSMYHCLLALLFKHGIKSENHTASIILLRELFKEKDLADIIGLAKKERIDKQYYIDFEVTRDDCEDMIKKTEKFTIKCKILIKKLDNDKIENIRKEFKNL